MKPEAPNVPVRVRIDIMFSLGGTRARVFESIEEAIFFLHEMQPVVPGNVYKIGDSYYLYTQSGNWEKLDGKVFD